MGTIANGSQRAIEGWLHALLRRRPSATATEAPGAGGDRARPTTRPVPLQDLTETQVVIARGDLSDWRAVQEFNQHCETLLRASGGRVVLDLLGVERADSKLVATIVALARHARSARIAFEIRPSSHVWTWITLCGVDRHLARHLDRPAPKSPSGGVGVWSWPGLSENWKRRREDPLILV